VATRWRQDGDKTENKREQKLDDMFWGKSFFFGENGTETKRRNKKNNNKKQQDQQEQTKKVLDLIC
jgi:hypothetical protein